MMDITTITDSLISQASSTEQVAAVAGGARSLLSDTYPFWGTGMAIAIVPIVLGLVATAVLMLRRPAPKQKHGRWLEHLHNDVNATVYHADLESKNISYSQKIPYHNEEI